SRFPGGFSPYLPSEGGTIIDAVRYPLSMRCSEFRDLHCSFVDDTLAGVELVRMQRHIAECADCARLDASVRRSLMLVHSLKPIEPSAEFSFKLDARLRECRLHDLHVSSGKFRTVALIGAIASLIMMGYVAETMRVADQQVLSPDIVLPPAIAMAVPPDTTPAPFIVASVSTGIPIWPAAVLVEQGGLQTVSYTQAR
ncbi:MAG: zf-HC2 domain-containing protein, partial [Gemmatimonadaceae bacterium]